MTLSELSFSLPELLSLLGLAQVVYVLVYMVFRAGDFRTAALPFVYFLCLGFAFLADFAGGHLRDVPNFDLVQWFFWYAGPPLGVLLILQVARLGKLPAWKELWVLALPPLALAAALGFAGLDNDCHFPGACVLLRDWLSVTGLISGVLSLTALWPHRADLRSVAAQKGGDERYWLILTIVIVNLFLIGFMSLMGLTMAGTPQALLVRTIVGIALIYLTGTSLFRIYPLAMPIKAQPARTVVLKQEEQAAEERLKTLIELEKVYHEPSYSRSDLARELSVPESVVSKIISHAYGRTFPQLINEHRIADAQRLLAETDAPIKVISEEVGFNSLASFNRVFRDLAGQNPTDYRNAQRRA
jgi:AraC-like DNA-binding protein